MAKRTQKTDRPVDNQSPTKPAVSDVPPQSGKVITVRVVEGKIEISGDNRILLDGKDQVTWRCLHGELEVRFSPALSPFKLSRFAANRLGAARSGGTTERAQARPVKSIDYLIFVSQGRRTFFKTAKLEVAKA